MSGLKKHLLFCLSLAMMSSQVLADAPQARRADPTSGIVDVTLGTDSGLSGRYIDGEGRPIDGAIVTLSQRRQVVAQTATGTSGAYHLPQVRQGVYQLTTGTQTQTVRVWDARLAPPSARALATTVRQDQIVRGQLGLIGGSIGSTVGAVGGIAGAAAGGYSVTQSMDAQDEADAAVKEAAELREMMHVLMSP